MKIFDNLIESHKKGRNHLMGLLEELSEDQWEDSVGGNWSIQRAAVHIVNAEIYWMGEVDKKERMYLAKETTLDEFRERQEDIATEFRQKLLESDDKWLDGPEYTMRFVFVRNIQHNIYHCGMISALRHIVKATRLQSMLDSWVDMVDTVYSSQFRNGDY